MSGDKIPALRSIRWRLMGTMMFLMIGVLFLLTFFDIASQKRLMEEELEKRIALMKENLSERGKNFVTNLTQQVEKDITTFNFSALKENLVNSVKINKEVRYAILTDSSGTVFANTLRTDSGQSGQQTGEKDKNPAGQKEMTIREYRDENRRSVLEIVNPIQISVKPWGVIRIVFDLENLDKEVEASKAKISRQIGKMILTAGIFSLFMVVLCSIIAWFFSSRFTGPLIRLTHSARELSRGDFTQEIEVRQKDEIGILAEAMNQMVSSLSDIIRKNIVTSQSLSEASSDQTTSLRETAVLLEEMSSMTQQNAQNANQADALMKKTNGVVVRANTSMSHLTVSMDEISQASREIFKIVKTIDEIAFQTKMLALNASIEAARAGEAGAGFAVVAEEVKNLAMRSAEAARNTSALIEQTDRKVREGAEFVAGANAGFAEVATNASDVAELVSQISQASDEQNQRILQIKDAVSQMNTITQRNSDSAEELAMSMSLFRVSGD